MSFFLFLKNQVIIIVEQKKSKLVVDEADSGNVDLTSLSALVLFLPSTVGHCSSYGCCLELMPLSLLEILAYECGDGKARLSAH